MLAAGDDNPIQTRNALHEADVRPDSFDTFVFAWIDRCRADEVLALRNTPHVREQMRSHDPVDPDEHRRFLEDYGRLDRYDFVLIDTSRNRCVGVFYVTNLGSTAQIGKYIGDSDYIGKGIATRATESILDFCRSKAGLRRLTSTTRRDNPRNIALNAKLGFTQTGTAGEFVVMALDLLSLT
jgi:RimJ/RimL family protein N-acetyltransferase